jgi:hypothetical protein
MKHKRRSHTERWERSITDKRLAQVTGVCAVIGGLSWTAGTIIHASQPRGCVGDECALRPMRNTTTSTSVLLLAAGLLMLAFVATLLSHIKRSSHLGWTGIAGAAACGFGFAALGTGAAIQELLYDGDLPSMPWFVLGGGSALTAGLMLVGGTALRSRVIPRWAGMTMLVGAGLLVGANEQTSRVLLALPFAISWSCTGVALMGADVARWRRDTRRANPAVR